MWSILQLTVHCWLISILMFFLFHDLCHSASYFKLPITSIIWIMANIWSATPWSDLVFHFVWLCSNCTQESQQEFAYWIYLHRLGLRSIGKYVKHYQGTKWNKWKEAKGWKTNDKELHRYRIKNDCFVGIASMVLLWPYGLGFL